MVTSLTTAQFDQFLETDQIVVIVFSAEWCQPCEPFKQIVNAVSKESKHVLFGLVDVEKEKELSRDFGILSVPTVMIFREHVALCRASGVMTQQALIDLIAQAKALNMDEVLQGIAQQFLGE